MNWNKYQQEALTTAIYPLEREVDYTVLGLCSEVGELAEVFGLVGRITATEFEKRTKGEGGDCFWYAAAIADALKTPLQDVWNQAPHYVSLSSRLALLRGLTVASGNLAGLVKKSIRDDAGVVSSERKTKMLLELGTVLHLLVNLANLSGSSAEGFTQDNLNKLAARKTRGTLQGSGDYR